MNDQKRRETWKVSVDAIKAAIRDVPDFPKPGIVFKDISPILQDAALFRECIDTMAALTESMKPDILACIDARGFIFGSAIAYRLGCGMCMIRKAGKLPWQTEQVSYDLEYGSNVVEMHRDAVRPGENVVIVDDVLATGGTAKAAIDLVRRVGGNVAGVLFFLELSFLEGRSGLQPHQVMSLITV
ncbi:MAG: adenine phosphoribosyltransferase [Lentisphaerae bacterium]|nr:MAG: adenine phosphoribosyltransferase [Lentisphaerota bacterium]